MPVEVKRRVFLAGAGASALSATVVACSRSRSRPANPTPVVVGNHPLYIDSATNPGFEAATGTRVEYHEEITDDGAWLAAVSPQLTRGESIDRDLVIVSDWVANRMATRGWLTDVPSQIWALGMVGIAYDAKA